MQKEPELKNISDPTEDRSHLPPEIDVSTEVEGVDIKGKLVLFGSQLEKGYSQDSDYDYIFCPTPEIEISNPKDRFGVLVDYRAMQTLGGYDAGRALKSLLKERLESQEIPVRKKETMFDMKTKGGIDLFILVKVFGRYEGMRIDDEHMDSYGCYETHEIDDTLKVRLQELGIIPTQF